MTSKFPGGTTWRFGTCPAVTGPCNSPHCVYRLGRSVRGVPHVNVIKFRISLPSMCARYISLELLTLSEAKPKRHPQRPVGDNLHITTKFLT